MPGGATGGGRRHQPVAAFRATPGFWMLGVSPTADSGRVGWSAGSRWARFVLSKEDSMFVANLVFAFVAALLFSVLIALLVAYMG